MDRRYSITELVDIDRLRRVFEEFSKATGFTTGFVSYPEQELLIATGWRDICTKFHRACPASAECCKESNLYLTACLKDLKELNIKPCGNGLVDGATPVVIRGVHLASLATGQVLLNKPDLEFFKGLAKKYGYNTEGYLEALSKVPVVTEEQLKNALTFLSGLAVLIAEQGLSRLQMKETTDALTTQQHRLSSLLRTIPDYIYFKDTESRFTCINEALAGKFGLGHPEEAVGKSDFDFLSEEHARRAFADEQRIIATGQSVVDLEEREVWPDGRVTWVSTTKIPLRDANGEIEGIVGISRDITERKLAQETLLESEAQTRHLNEVLRAIRDIQRLIFSERDPARLLEGVCNVLVHTRGYLTAWVGKPDPDSKQVLPVAYAGKGVERVKHARVTWDDSPTGRGPCGCAIRERTPCIFNDIANEPRFAPWAETFLADGFRSIASVPLLYNDRLFGALTVKADRVQAFTQEEIDLLQGMASEIAHALQSIEHEEERNRTEEQLRQAQKMESIGQLAGGIAHDFNNILGATLLQINLLQEHPALAPELRPMLEELEKGTSRASNLTRQLLMFSRRQAVQIKPMDLNDLLDDLLNMFTRILGEPIELKLEKQAGPMWIAADKGMMEQMVINFVVNARDAMPGGGRLVIGTRRVQIQAGSLPLVPEARPGSFVQLSVADTGCGIEEKDLKRIFEPFFTTKEIGKGTGLGLASVYGIVKQHEGWIEVESAVGKGAAFHVFLPAIPSPSQEESIQAPNRLQRGQETLLIAEDDEALRSMLVLSLTQLGYQVLQAENGSAAVRLWNERAEEIDLLISDMVMPGGISGLDLVQQFRQTHPRLKAIISSGYSPAITRLGAEAEGQFTLLPKPYQLETLAAVVRKALDQG